MALSSAEKQKAYRERERVKLEALRQAANGGAGRGNVTDPSDGASVRIAALEWELERSKEQVQAQAHLLRDKWQPPAGLSIRTGEETTVADLRRKLAKAEARVAELERESADAVPEAGARMGPAKPIYEQTKATQSPDFPEYIWGSGVGDITSRQIMAWLEGQMLSNRIPAHVLMMIGGECVYLAQQYTPKQTDKWGNPKRLQKPRQLDRDMVDRLVNHIHNTIRSAANNPR